MNTKKLSNKLPYCIGSQGIMEIKEKTKIIDMHRGHPKRIVYGNFGPHKAKMECALCKCWIKWMKV